MKKRIDSILFEKDFYESRSKAQAAVMTGKVFVNGQKVIKSGDKFNEDDILIEVKEDFPYVSRGALKLLTAMREFEIDFDKVTAIDIGASTGGFTDVMLKNGAKKVLALDVGYNQLHYSLRTNDKVICLEKTNARTFEDKTLLNSFDVAVGDLSFISITKIYENMRKYVKDSGILIFLIKPQFEACKNEIGKRGLVKDILIHRRIILDIIEFINSFEDTVENLCPSDIKGNKSGNQEYLIKIIKKNNKKPLYEEMLKKAGL
ncbi:MAG: TlyA family RNA methyltransferase [Candidatus Muirbacterium halophilum]|nr:TlyA family RNA methyltransferase [Candidatus Muirbacterium halophilum]MCK9476840.1 TlyA family RNA methyltransferase [Candidatus Muirbacterium halophilum]